MKRGIFLATMILLVTLLFLSACSGSTQTTSTTATSPTTSVAPSSSTPPATSTTSATTSTTKPPTSTGAAKYGGTLRLSRFTAEGVSLGDPANQRGMNSWWQSTPALEPLLRTGATGELIPWLATAWTVDAPTNTINLTIRQGVKFHDGTPLNAQAVAWNIQYRMDAKMPAFGSFASVAATDDNTVKITLKSWDSTVLYNLASGPGLIISPTNYQKNGAQYAADHPVGTGAFVFASWDKNNKVTYTKNTNYWQPGKPYLDSIVWQTIPDMNTKALSFVSGELDVVVTIDLPQVQTIEAAGFKPVLQPVSGGADGFIPSSNDPSSPWNNVKVRQAAAYAINNDEFVSAIFGELGQAVNQFVPKGNWAYNPDVVGYPYNPAKSKQLLTEAGYASGFDTVFYGFQDATMNKRVLAIVDYLKKVNINCSVQIISPAEMTDRQSNGQGWNGLIWDSLGQSMDVTDTLNRYYTGGSKNFVSMLHPADFVKGIQDAVASPDFPTKQKLVQNVMKLLTDTYSLMLLQDTRLDVAFEQKYIMNSGILKTPNTQMWTPEDCWLNK